MKKKGKIIIIICAVVLVGIVYSFLLKRYKGNIRAVINDIDSGYTDYYIDDFINEIEDYKNNEDTINLFYVYQKSKYLNDNLSKNTCYKTNNISPSIYIYTYDNSGLSLEKETGYVDCQIVYIDKDCNPIFDYDSKVKIRGNSTSGLDKKPYTIKFSEKRSLMDAGKAKKWNLLAEAYDPTLLRNNVFLSLAETMGLPYTSKHGYIEVYMDSMYVGCYLLTESVEVSKERVDLDLDNKDFFIEFESWRVEDDVYYFTPTKDIRLALKEPEEPTDEQLTYYEDTIKELMDILYGNNYEELCKYFDVDSFVKYYVLNEYAKTADIGQSSVNYYYKDGKLYAGPVWDFDLSSGNADDRVFLTYWNKYNGEKVPYINYYCREENPIFKQLFKYKEVEELYKTYFDQYKDDLKHLYEDGGFIDQTLKTYQSLFDRNYTPLKEGGAGWEPSTWIGYLQIVPFESYQDNVDFLINYLKNRFEWLSSNN